MKRLNCTEVKYLLPDYVQGTISDEDISLVARHLHECKDCPRELESMQELYAILDSRKEAGPEVSYWPTLLPRIHERIEERKNRFAPQWVPRLAFPLAVLAVLVLVAIRVYAPSTGITGIAAGGNGIGVRDILAQMDSTELQAVSSEYFTSNNLITLISETNLMSSDGEILKEMIADVRLSSLQPDIDTRAIVDNLTDEEADAVVSRLSQKRLMP